MARTIEEHQEIVRRVEAHAATNNIGKHRAAQELKLSTLYSYALSTLKAKAGASALGIEPRSTPLLDGEPDVAEAEEEPETDDQAELVDDGLVRVYVIDGAPAAVAQLLRLMTGTE